MDPICDVCGEPVVDPEELVEVQEAARTAHLRCMKLEKLSRLQRTLEQDLGRVRLRTPAPPTTIGPRKDEP